jgi:hypothetical protein
MAATWRACPLAFLGSRMCPGRVQQQVDSFLMICHDHPRVTATSPPAPRSQRRSSARPMMPLNMHRYTLSRAARAWGTLELKEEIKRKTRNIRWRRSAATATSPVSILSLTLSWPIRSFPRLRDFVAPPPRLLFPHGNDPAISPLQGRYNGRYTRRPYGSIFSFRPSKRLGDSRLLLPPPSSPVHTLGTSAARRAGLSGLLQAAAAAALKAALRLLPILAKVAAVPSASSSSTKPILSRGVVVCRPLGFGSPELGLFLGCVAAVDAAAAAAAGAACRLQG